MYTSFTKGGDVTFLVRGMANLDGHVQVVAWIFNLGLLPAKGEQKEIRPVCLYLFWRQEGILARLVW